MIHIACSFVAFMWVVCVRMSVRALLISRASGKFYLRRQFVGAPFRK